MESVTCADTWRQQPPQCSHKPSGAGERDASWVDLNLPEGGPRGWEDSFFFLLVGCCVGTLCTFVSALFQWGLCPFAISFCSPGVSTGLHSVSVLLQIHKEGLPSADLGLRVPICSLGRVPYENSETKISQGKGEVGTNCSYCSQLCLNSRARLGALSDSAHRHSHSASTERYFPPAPSGRNSWEGPC